MAGEHFPVGQSAPEASQLPGEPVTRSAVPRRIIPSGRREGWASFPPASPANACAGASTSTTAERSLVLTLDLKDEMPHPAEGWDGFCPVHVRPDAPLAITTSFPCSLHHNPAQKILPQGTGDPQPWAGCTLRLHFSQPPAMGFGEEGIPETCPHLHGKAGGHCLLGASVSPNAWGHQAASPALLLHQGGTCRGQPCLPSPWPTGVGNGWCRPDISARC